MAQGRDESPRTAAVGDVLWVTNLSVGCDVGLERDGNHCDLLLYQRSVSSVRVAAISETIGT